MGLPLADRFFFEIGVPVKGAPAAALRFRKGGFAIMAVFAVFINENEICFTGVEICDHIFCTDLAVCATLDGSNHAIRKSDSRVAFR